MAGNRNGKTPAKTSVRPQPHGGVLQVGNPGNRGGVGVVPSILRDRLRGSFEQRVTVLEAVADGEVVQNAEIPLATVLQHAHCPRCDVPLKPNPNVSLADDALTVTMRGKTSASVNDRIKAIDLLAKYGLGTIRELTTDVVRDKLVATIALVRRELPEDDAERVLQGMRAVWA